MPITSATNQQTMPLSHLTSMQFNFLILINILTGQIKDMERYQMKKHMVLTLHKTTLLSLWNFQHLLHRDSDKQNTSMTLGLNKSMENTQMPLIIKQIRHQTILLSQQNFQKHTFKNQLTQLIQLVSELNMITGISKTMVPFLTSKHMLLMHLKILFSSLQFFQDL